MRQRIAVLAATALALAAGILLGTAGPALADGFKVNVSDPGTFTAGGGPQQLTAVISSDDAKRCREVRWGLTLKTDGIAIGQVRVVRMENGQQFATRANVSGNAISVSDVAPDPGQVCKGRTDTAQWAIAFIGPDTGKISIGIHAVDALNRPLGAGHTDATVVAGQAVATHTTAAPKPTAAAPTTSFSAGPIGALQPTQSASSAIGLATPPQAIAKSSSGSTLGVGLAIGAILVLAGIALLIWLRRRGRGPRGPHSPAWQGETQMLPTGFNNYPPR